MRMPFLRTMMLTACVVTICLGCSGKETIVNVPIEGTLLIDGKPLPLAQVEFMPEFKGHGAQANSFGITDDKGKFKLMNGGEVGAAIATHRVVVTDAPPPGDTRGQDEASQQRLSTYMNNLQNRPIPVMYQTYTSTPLRVEVTAEKRDVVIELRR